MKSQAALALQQPYRHFSDLANKVAAFLAVTMLEIFSDFLNVAGKHCSSRFGSSCQCQLIALVPNPKGSRGWEEAPSSSCAPMPGRFRICGQPCRRRHHHLNAENNAQRARIPHPATALRYGKSLRSEYEEPFEKSPPPRLSDMPVRDLRQAPASRISIHYSASMKVR